MIFAPERMARIDVWTLCEDAERLASLLTREGSVHMVERRISTGEGEGFSPLERQNGRQKIERLGRQAESMLHRLGLMPLDLSMEQQEQDGPEVVYADGTTTRVDAEEIRAKAREQAKRLHARL